MKLVAVTTSPARRHKAYGKVTVRIRNDPVSRCEVSVSRRHEHVDVGHNDKVVNWTRRTAEPHYENLRDGWLCIARRCNPCHSLTTPGNRPPRMEGHCPLRQ